MARYKTALLLILFSVIAVPAAGFTFDVSIDDVTSTRATDVKYSENVSGVQNLNASVENSGSIGCVYRLRAEYRYGNRSFDRYSTGVPLWPGDTHRAKVYLITSNYRGTVSGNLTAEYCGQTEKVQEFNYATSNITLGNSTESRTYRADSEGADISVEDFDEGMLVPVEAPPHWKTSSTSLTDGEAEISYDPPIFTDSENITYAVVQNGTVEATTEVGLRENPTVVQGLMNTGRLPLFLLIILLAALNLAQYLRARTDQN